MHVGNLRSALYEFLIAKHAGGDFMLRIEDTDQERYVEGATEIIYRTLEKTGLVHDEGPDKDGGYGPYVQSERMKTGIYMKYAKELIDKGEAYYCFCDKERLASLKTEVVDGKEILASQKDRPISDVAAFCGISDVSHFISVFKKVTGVTPKQWRDGNAGKEDPQKEVFGKNMAKEA